MCRGHPRGYLTPSTRFLRRQDRPTVTTWSTAHGDLQWANLTAPAPYLLDWEGWGIAPAGYDAATLYCYSLLAPNTARRVYETFTDILDTSTAHASNFT
ncbi:MAG: hypothetical protein ACRDSZ_01695 [Pseudonocardiaceae bacterium]